MVQIIHAHQYLRSTNSKTTCRGGFVGGGPECAKLERCSHPGMCIFSENIETQTKHDANARHQEELASSVTVVTEIHEYLRAHMESSGD